MKILLIVVWLPLILCTQIFAEDEIVEEKKKKKKSDQEEVKISISYEEAGVGEEAFESGFGRLFNDPALSSGIANGSALINKSLQSVMDLVFYRLLDQDLAYDINDHSQFGFSIKRDLFPTPQGAYVVVDRFGLGPKYLRELATIQQMPLSLGVQGKVSVFDIYLITHGIRLAEQAELPFWRVAVNNWFGILPLLSAVLPPSFNANELYNPVNLLETPFSFPITIGGFRSMPVASIRSYNISSGLTVPLNIFERFPKDLRDRVTRADHLQGSLPLSVFVEGEYRINVLRRSKNIAWVGVTKTKRFGERISTAIGRAIRLMDKLILANWWTGVPAKLFPLDVEWVHSRAKIQNQLYEFDLRRADARKAYLQAVKGEFMLANQMHVSRLNEGKNTGVKFHFTQNEIAKEESRSISPNLILLSNRRSNSQKKSEIEITDEEGKFYVLRAEQKLSDIFMEALTGRQKIELKNLVEMKVLRIPDPDHPKDDTKYIYKFDPAEKDPINAILSFGINDRYLNAHEYREYMNELRYFTKLKLREAPNIPRRDRDLITERIKRMALQDPEEKVLKIHVTPTYLGRFSATAALSFSTKVIDAIIDTSTDQKWAAFAEAYGLRKEDWQVRQSREEFWHKLYWMRYASALPLESINIRRAEWDFISEAHSAIAALAKIEDGDTPLEKLKGFYQLFDTNYPVRMASALLSLCNISEVPRSISFYTRARGGAKQSVKQAYNRLNNKVFRSVRRFPPPARSRIADEKQSAFYPDELRERRLRPRVQKIDVSMSHIERTIETKNQSKPPEQPLVDTRKKHIYVRLYAKNMNPARKAKIYVKIEESGKLQLGKFVLDERVIKLEPREPNEDENLKLGTLVYEFFLSGPQSPLSGIFYENAMKSGGEFQVVMGISNDGKVWSDERDFRFVLSQDRLYPP